MVDGEVRERGDGVIVTDEELPAADVLAEQGYAAWLRELVRREGASCPPDGVEISPSVGGSARR